MLRYAIATVLVVVPGTAFARDQMYSWKANVTREAFDRDQLACVGYARDVANGKTSSNPYNPATQSTAAGAMGSAFGAGIAAGIMKAKARNAAYDACLHDGCSSQRRLPAEEYKAFKTVDGKVRKARLMEMMSAPTALHP